MVAQGRLDLLGGGEDHRGRIGDEVERRAEAVERQHLGQARRLLLFFGRLHRRQLGQFAVLGVELGRRRQLDPLGVAERALGEGREPAHRLDLVAEELDPHRALLGGAEDVEDAAADGELAALLDLLDPVVAGAVEVAGDRREVDLPALGDREAGRAQGGVGHRLGQRRGAGDDHRVVLAPERVESVDPQPDQVRRRGDVGGEAGPARGVEADAARRQVGAQVGGEVAGGAVVGADDQRRALGEPAVVLEQRRQQQRPQHRRGGDLDLLAAGGGIAHAARQRVDALVLGGYVYERTKTHRAAQATLPEMRLRRLAAVGSALGPARPQRLRDPRRRRPRLRAVSRPAAVPTPCGAPTSR